MTAVAIDGPAGAGKSTVARAVARSLGWRFVDTGAMYRAVALLAIETGVELGDEKAMGELASAHEIEAYDGGTFVDGRDVAEPIRSPEVTELVSRIAAYPLVRRALVAKQRHIAAMENVVMEGRDIGTEVLPEAEVKVYLTATTDERARRRAAESAMADRSVESVREDIEARDRADSTREASPLRRAPGAIVVDSTGRSIEEVVQEIVEAVRATTAAHS